MLKVLVIPFYEDSQNSDLPHRWYPRGTFNPPGLSALPVRLFGPVPNWWHGEYVTGHISEENDGFWIAIHDLEELRGTNRWPIREDTYSLAYNFEVPVRGGSGLPFPIHNLRLNPSHNLRLNPSGGKGRKIDGGSGWEDLGVPPPPVPMEDLGVVKPGEEL